MLSCELHHRHIVNLKFGRTPGAAQISAMPQMSLWSNGMLPGRIARCLSLMLLFLIVHLSLNFQTNTRIQDEHWTCRERRCTHAQTQRRLHRWTISTRPCSADTQGAVQLRNSIPGRKSSGAAGQPFEVPGRRPWYWREVWRRELILNDFGLYKGIAWSYSLVTISTHHYTYLCRFDFRF